MQLAIGVYHLCAGLPVYSVLNAPFRPLGLPYVLTVLFHFFFPVCFTSCSHISCCRFLFLQGGCAFATKVSHLRDPALRKLAVGLPLRAVKAKALSTTERYSRALEKFREWSSCYKEVLCLPSDEMSVALHLEFFLRQSYPYSTLGSACYDINWAHNVYGFPSPCDSKLVKTCSRL